MRNGSVLSKSLSQITREDGNIVSFLYGEPTSLPVIEVVTDDDLEDVAGGIAPLLAVALWYGACAIGFAIMFEVNSRKTGERW